MKDSTNMTPFDIAKLYKKNNCKNILDEVKIFLNLYVLIVIKIIKYN